MHPKRKCTHEQNRFKVCATCGKKIVCSGRPISWFAVNERIDCFIKKYVNKDYNVLNSKFPVSICTSCRLTLSEHERNIKKRPLPVMPNYKDLNSQINTRSRLCKCYLCFTAKEKMQSKVIKGRGHSRKFFYGVQKKNHGSLDRCNTCFQEIGKGVNHYCTGPSSSSARENVLNIIEQFPEKQQNRLLTSMLRKKQNNNDLQDEEMLLNTSGAKARVSFNKRKENKISFTVEGLNNYQAITGVSNRHMIAMTNFIRSFAGRNSIETNFRTKMQENSHLLENIYEEGIFKFETAKMKEGIMENRPVVYANATNLLVALFEKRDISSMDNVRVKVMADGGKDFLKILLSVLVEETCDFSNNDMKRSEYSAGGTLAKGRKSNSVYKLILLCVVPNIKETHHNIQILFDLTKLNEIPFKFVADFKLLLAVLGQQTASATYPCPYCFITLNELHQFNQNFNREENLDNDTVLKTFKDLKEVYLKYKNFGNLKKFAKKCHSTVNDPLFVKEEDDEDDDMVVLRKCVLPELHLLQGFVNHLFWDGLVPLVGREKALIWPKKLNLVAKSYQGEIFEGNACRQLLRQSALLDDPEIYEKVGPFALKPFEGAFQEMNKIVNSCFTTKQADIKDIDKNLTALRKALQSTGVSQTIKIHVILDHLKEGILQLEGDGLGLWSEQAGESVHREFEKFWQRFKINIIEDQSYSRRLKDAVSTFSSQHI